MPERLHTRLDGGSVPLESVVRKSATLPTEDTSSKSKKRKREHVDRTHPRQQTDDQSQRLDKPYGSQPIKLANPMSKSPSYELVRRPNDGYRLKDRAKSLESSRKSLPIWSHVREICVGLSGKDVMLMVGETGSGKSTQVPQMLVHEQWCQSRSAASPQNATLNDGEPPGSVDDPLDRSSQTVTVGGCIVITEPRRVAAITLARRVAEEIGTPLGSSSPKSTVGYSVRFDQSTSPNTRIKFVTEGTLLQEMLRDPWLKAYSAVIVDEVHERGVNVDLLLGFLRNMVTGRNEGRGGIPLKVILMSATAETDNLRAFFEEGYGERGDGSHDIKEDQENGTTVSADQEEAESEWSGISSSAGEDAVANHRNGTAKASQYEGKEPQSKHTSHVAICFIEGRQYPVTLKYTTEAVQDIVEASLRMIFQIHRQQPMPGDVLVFFHGRDIIESLEGLVKEYARDMGPELPKLLVLPLFAALSQAAQQRVFQPAPPKTRKIIIATNIAETSVTVPGVRFVIDSGKAKIKQFRTSIGMESLLVKPISQSSAIQRQGRAGREAPGQCYRLYTEKDYPTMQKSNTPEILRCDLSHAILTMKARGIDDVVNFSFLDHPPRKALEKAFQQLFLLGALTESGRISDSGQQIAKLPVTVSLGRALVAAAESEPTCVPEVIDIVSCLSVENLFLNLTSEEKKKEAELARRELYKREGDHLTLLAAVQAYAAENTDRKAWAERHFISHRAMKAVMDVRKQLRAQCQQSKLLKLPQNQEPSMVTPELAISILKCLLRGFATKTARLCPDGSYKTMVGNQVVAIHPSSGLFGKKVEAIMFNEFVFTNRSYAKGVSAVQLNWIPEAFAV